MNAALDNSLRYTLTTGADSIIGTGSDDIINGLLTDGAANQATFQTWDSIDGGAGTNTLNVQTNGAATISATLANIQNMNVQQGVAGAPAVLNLGGLSTLANLGLEGLGAGSGFTVNSLGSLPTVALTGTGALTTLNFTAAALSPTGQTLNVDLNSVTGGLTLTDTGSNALETLSLSSLSAANTLATLTSTNIGLTTVSIDGNQNLTIGNAIDGTAGGSTLKTFNASGLTGELNLTIDTTIANATVTGGSANDTIDGSAANNGFLMSLTGGAGNDTFVVGTNLNANTTIAGGDGALDILSADGAALDNFTAALPTTNVSGIESIRVTTTAILTPNTLLLSAIQAGIADVDLRVGGAPPAAATAHTGTITFDAGVAGNIDVGSASNNDSVAGLTVTVAGTGTADSVTIDNDTTAVDILGAGTLTLTGIETATIDGTTTGAAAVNQTGAGIAMTASAGGTTTLKLIGNNSFVPTAAFDAGTIDASGLGTTAAGIAAVLTMNAGSALTSTVIGGGGNDTLLAGATKATNISGGAGADTITGSSANDTLLGGDGNDSITAGAGNDSIDAGAGNDVVVMAGNLANADTVAGGDGTDTLNVSAAITAATGANVSQFETLRATAGIAQDMAVLSGSNAVVTYQDYRTAAAGAATLTNTSAGFNSIVVGTSTTGGTLAMSRLVDGTADTVTISRQQITLAGGGAASGYTTTTLNDEDTINITTGDADNGFDDLFTLGTGVGTGFSATDAATITVTGNDSVSIVLATDGLGTSGSTAINFSGVVSDALALRVTFDGTGSTAVGASAVITGSTVEVNNIIGTGGADSITGGAANDTLAGGAGADTVDGGTGVDTFSAVGMNAANIDGGATASVGAVVNLSANTLTPATIGLATGGLATASGTLNVATNTTAYLGAGGAGLAATQDTLVGIENATGSGGTDYIVGSAAANTLDGDAGADTIEGGAGNDTITGGTGIDALTGGDGADSFVLNQALNANRDLIADFTVAQGDVLSLSAAVYTNVIAGGAVTVLDNAAAAALIAAGVAGSAVNSIVVATAAQIGVLNFTGEAVGAMFAIESDTGNLLYDANGDFTGGSVVIGTVTAAQGALVAAGNVSFIA